MLANTILADTLSALIGLSSVAFYVAAFFYPEVHRRSDIAWSGLGVFYALILWLCAGQMTLAVLLGQIAVVALVCGLGWQTLTIRREKTPIYQQTPVIITPEVVGNWAKNTVNDLRIAPAEPVPLKLEKRSFSEFSEERLGQRIDPRRRPAYEYEFVEDGILEGSELEIPADPQLTLDLTSGEMSDVKADDNAPPSAIAQIISVESESIESELLLKEPAQTIGEATTTDDVEPDSNRSEAPEARADDAEGEASEAATVDSDILRKQIEKAPDELEANERASESFEPESSESESFESESSEPAEPEQDDWTDDIFGDDIFEDASATIEPPTQTAKRPQSRPAELKKKPGLLATPLILIGWIKDVTASFTQPKPSKPIIEIPLRESSNETTFSQQKPLAAEPLRTEQAIAPIERDDETDDWEESNWDD